MNLLREHLRGLSPYDLEVRNDPRTGAMHITLIGYTATTVRRLETKIQDDLMPPRELASALRSQIGQLTMQARVEKLTTTLFCKAGQPPVPPVQPNVIHMESLDD